LKIVQLITGCSTDILSDVVVTVTLKEDVQTLFTLQDRGALSSPTWTAGAALDTHHSIFSSTPSYVPILMGFPPAS